MLTFSMMQKLIPILCLALAACSEKLAEVAVAPELPQGVRPDFMERIDSTTLKEAIDRAGQNVQVEAGEHALDIPCDGVSENEFAKVTFKVDPQVLTVLTFKSCGVSFQTIFPE